MPARLPRDAALVCAAGGVRAAAVSLVGVVIGVHFAARGLSAAAIGLVLGAGIAASAAGTVVVGLRADRWGRRRTLAIVGLMSAAGYAALGIVRAPGLLVAIAAAAMVNGMGRDRGPASTLEQAILPDTTSDAGRTWTMAWYNTAVDAGHAIGAIGAALPTILARTLAVGADTAHAVTFASCGAAVLASTLPYAWLSARLDNPQPARTAAPIDPATRSVVRRLTALFAVDSVGGGFLSSALVAYWFFERYGTSETQLAGLFFAGRVLNVASHLTAARIARRAGLLNTMVFTHLPSSLLLMLAPAAPTAGMAMALFLAREALVEMDVPTRQSYVMAVVPPPARTYASGLTNVARNAGWAVGPFVGGTLMQQAALAAPLVIGGALKIVYDVALYRAFRHVRPPEERAAMTPSPRGGPWRDSE